MPVDDASGHRFKEVRMRDRVEIFRQISVDNIGVAPANEPVRFLDRTDRAAARSIAIGAVLEVRLEDRLEHDLGGGLGDPIPYRRHAPTQLHSFPNGLWDRLKSSIRFTLCAVSDSQS